MTSPMIERPEDADIAGELAGHRLFGSLHPDLLRLIAGCATSVALTEHERLLSAGDPADHFWLIRSGRVDIEIHGSPFGTRTIQRLGPGDIVGVSWIAPPFRAEFDATCLEPGTALRFDGRCLRAKCDDDPVLGWHLHRAFASLLRDRLHAARLQLVDLYGRTP